jgi:acyl carrier protein
MRTEIGPVTDSVLDKVRELIAESTPLAPKDIKPEAELVKDLGLSSLEIVMLAARVESTFQVRFEADDTAGLTTVASVVESVRQRSR